MSDPILDRLRAGGKPSDMRQIAFGVWQSVDRRYLVVWLAVSNFQCFERRKAGWVAANRPCGHAEQVIRQEEGGNQSRLTFPTEHAAGPTPAQVITQVRKWGRRVWREDD